MNRKKPTAEGSLENSVKADAEGVRGAPRISQAKGQGILVFYGDLAFAGFLFFKGKTKGRNKMEAVEKGYSIQTPSILFHVGKFILNFFDFP